MAKSKSGGTRSYLRGKIGADVYSIGKDGKGAKQQVVRSLAEVVSNPQTEAQMRGRMIMSTVMQAVSAMSQIIDHSFDGVPAGQPSISEFIRQNYALVKADVAAHPASGNAFGLNKYQEKGIRQGAWLVSTGAAVLPSAVKFSQELGFHIELTADTLTVGGLKAALENKAESYFTLVGITYNNGYSFKYARVHLTTTLEDATAISAENVTSLFTIEGNEDVIVSLEQNNILFMMGDVTGGDSVGIIYSDKVNGTWIHNKVALSGAISATYTADVALPTYPVGAARFLNGGEL